MPADWSLVIGLVLAGLAGLNLLARTIDRHPPRMAAVLGALGVGLILYAEIGSGWAYGPADVPLAVVRVAGEIRG